MKGYKRLKIPISSGCQAGPGYRHQVEVGSGVEMREMVEKWNAALSLIVILPLKLCADQGSNNQHLSEASAVLDIEIQYKP